MKPEEIEEILICVETNFEELTSLTYTLSDIGEIATKFLEIITVIMTFVFLLIYALFSEKSPNLLFGVAAAYIAFVTLMVTTAPTRDQSLEETEFHHNIRKIERLYSEKELFERHYPIIKALVVLKQKNPEIDLQELCNLNRDIFTAKTLTSLLCGVNLNLPRLLKCQEYYYCSTKIDVQNEWKQDWKKQAFCSEPDLLICSLPTRLCCNAKYLYSYRRCDNI